MARNSNPKAIANSVLSNKTIKEKVVELICGDIESEAKKLCSSKSPSLLKTPSKETLSTFSWELIEKEVKNKAPLIYDVLKAVATPKLTAKRDKQATSTTSSKTRIPGILLATGVLLKIRNPTMTLIPYIISLTLRTAGTSKMVLIFPKTFYCYALA